MDASGEVLENVIDTIEDAVDSSGHDADTSGTVIWTREVLHDVAAQSVDAIVAMLSQFDPQELRRLPLLPTVRMALGLPPMDPPPSLAAWLRERVNASA